MLNRFSNEQQKEEKSEKRDIIVELPDEEEEKKSEREEEPNDGDRGSRNNINLFESLGGRSISSGTDGTEGSQSESEKSCSCVDSILLIDDICYNVIPMKMQLKTLLNVHVETCTNGKQGLDRYVEDISKTCCQKYFHLILMDLNMPMMDGCNSALAIHGVYEELKK